ncbi:MAG: LysE family transporter [Candidatus Kapaibacterium sp.]
MIISLVVGLITGFLLSMPPMGPTNILVISLGLRKEIKYGVAVGAGAGFMDMIYIIISYGGFALIKGFVPESINDFFVNNEKFFMVLLTLVGCIVVGLSGYKLIKTKVEADITTPAQDKKIENKLSKVTTKLEQTNEDLSRILHSNLLQKKENGLVGGFLKGAFLCVSSVTIPASWFALTGYMKNYGIIDSRFITGLIYSIGVFAGTTLWFWTLVKVISENTHRVSPEALNKINIIVGGILLLLSLFLLYKVIDFSLS